MTISEHYDEISHCNRCGFCQVACPIFRSTGHEAGVARGRLALLRAIIEGRLEWSPEIEAPLFDCLLCGACTASCFPAIPTSELIIKARAEYLERVGRKSIHRLLLKIFGRDLVHANEIVASFPARAFRDQVNTGVHQGQGQSLRVGYFVGCGVDIINQDAAQATLKLLKKNARTVHVLQNCCCGLPAWSYGDLKAAQKLAVKNLSILASDQFDLIVTDCSSCASFLKNYTRLFPKEDQRHQAAKAVSARVKDMVQFIHSMKVRASSSHSVLSVTYHHPCHAARGQGLINEPAEILGRLAGVEYRELPEADWCCGGAGSYAFAHYELSQQVLNRKMENLKKTGADLLVTSCPACIMQLSYGIRKHDLSTKVCHISELV
jgi:glycolate oxidase iron-sulfur subunit